MAGYANSTLSCVNISETNSNESCTGELFKYYYEYKEYRIYQFFSKNSYHVTTIPAIPLNVMCIAVVIGMRPFNSSCLFMFTLGWADLVCVLCRLVYVHVDGASSEFVCKFLRYLANSSLVYSNFVLLCFTLERLFVTSFPLKASQICTKRNAGIALVSSLILCLALNTVYATDSFVEVINGNGTTTRHCILTPFAGNTWTKIFSLYHNLIPITVIALCNAGIIYNLKMHNRKKRKLTNQVVLTPSTKSDPTRTLVVVSVVFTVLHLPYVIFNLVVPDYPAKAELPSFDQRLMARLLLIGNLCYGIMCLQNGVNFFLYCWATDKFRRSFCRLLTPFKLISSWCLCRSRNMRQSSPISSTPHGRLSLQTSGTNIMSISESVYNTDTCT